MNPSDTNAFFIGVVSGVAAIWILFLARKTLGIFASWLSAELTRARSVDGKWKTTFMKNGKDYHETAQLHQLGPWVWGTTFYADKGRIYKLKGTLRADILVATYETTESRSTVDRGAFTLTLTRFGRNTSMKGRYCWTDDDSFEPHADEYHWERES
jgi:hypothetical protein